MKLVRIRDDWFESGALRYAGGALYPVSDDTKRQVELGNGYLVDAPDDADKADAAAVKAEARADDAAAAAQAARDAADAAAAAQAAREAEDFNFNKG